MRTLTLAAAILASAVALTGCSSSGGNTPTAVSTAACEQALAKQFSDAMGASPSPGSRPPACVGVDDATLQKLVGQAMTDYLNTATAVPTP